MAGQAESSPESFLKEKDSLPVYRKDLADKVREYFGPCSKRHGTGVLDLERHIEDPTDKVRRTGYPE